MPIPGARSGSALNALFSHTRNNGLLPLRHFQTFPGLPHSWLWHTSPLQAVFTQPSPVLSLGSELQSWSLSSQPPPAPAGEQTSHSGWGVLVCTDPLCGNISALPSAPLLLRSPLWLQSFPPSHPLSPPVKGLPSVWKHFLLHSSLPEVQVHPYSFVSVFSFALVRYMGTVLPYEKSEVFYQR